MKEIEDLTLKNGKWLLFVLSWANKYLSNVKIAYELLFLVLISGGKIVAYDDPKCTHLIIDAIPGDQIELSIDLSSVSKHIYIVYKEVGFYCNNYFVFNL